MNIPQRAATLVAMTASLALNGASPDTLTFITGGSLASTEILSVNAASPTTVFEGVSIEDYEPAYAYFTKDGSNDGAKYFISDEINTEILRPYNVVRATENGAATMTVQFQGVTRFHVSPHTASVTIKFTQSGDNVVAYVVRAAALKPLDIELGLDIDTMVDNGDPRVVAKTLSGVVGSYNISVITMRKPAAAVACTGIGYSYNILKTGYESEVGLGLDFESYSSSSKPARGSYNNHATQDADNSRGVKQLNLSLMSMTE